ncbi:MAG: glucosamine-6-phosphate deaminase [Eubacteriales bacterium]|nr:glucosamine-6-phosphate deaminase [Eubacteriales bacterium]
MNVYILSSAEQVAKNCAMLISSQLISKPDSVFGLATGSSPVRCYEYLAQWYKEGLLDFSRATSFNLDEYIGLDAQHEQSYRYFMQEKLFKFINLKQSFLPNGVAENLEEECKRYDDLLASYGGADLQLLGIGRNAHIAFNEPSDVFSAGTRVVDLTQSTINANKRFFESADMVPKKAITMGIGTIMSAKKIVLIATGLDKAEAIKKTIDGDIDPKFPSSILKLHKDTTLLIDREAATLL